MMKPMKKIVIIIVLFLPLCLFLAHLLLFDDIKIVYSENRAATNANELKIDKFKTGGFQKTLENYLLDQFPASETLKVKYNILKNDLSSFMNKLLLKQDCNTGLTQVSDTIYNFYCYDQLVPYFYQPDSYFLSVFQDFNKIIMNNAPSDTEIYLYFINNALTFDYENKSSNYKFFEYFKDAFGHYKYDELEIKSDKEFLEFFYKTDHHLNYKGSYLVYEEVMNLLGIEEIVKPIRTVEFENSFCGSYCREIGFYKYKDNFIVHEFDLDYRTIINGEEMQYGYEKEYLGGWLLNEYDNYYAGFYGGDFGEVIFDYSQENKDNLLIFSNSYSNSINKLISSHFNKTYVIDLRHYENDMGSKFNLREYCEKNKIDKVLFLGDIDFYWKHTSFGG